MTLNDLEIEK